MKRLFLTILAVLILAGQAWAVEYNSDSVVFDASDLTEIEIIDVQGASAIDTYPVGNPDGWIPKQDSPYYNPNVPDLGQAKLYEDKFANNVKKYDGYVDGSFLGKSWEQLSSYWKMSFHMTNEQSTTQIGWQIQIKSKVDTTLSEYDQWDTNKSPDGFNDTTAVIFTDTLIEVNTRYLFGHQKAGTALRSSAIAPNNKSLWLDLFISDQSVFDQFLADLNAWNNAPNLIQVSPTKWEK